MNRRLLVVLLVGAVVRVAWVLYAARKPIGGDPGSYLYYGRQIARGKGYVSLVTGTPTAFYPIGYPALVAAVFFVLLHTPVPNNLPLAVGLVQAALGVGTVYLTYEVARRLFDARVALVAAALQAVYPGLVFHTAVAFTETLFNFTVMASLFVVCARPWAGGTLSRGRLLAFGAILGVSASVRPFSLLFLGPLVVAWLVAGAGWRRTAVQFSWVVLAVGLVLTPWTVRNIVRMGSPIVLSSNLGDTLCISRAHGATGRFEYCKADIRKVVSLDHVPAKDFEVKQANANLRQALRFVKHHPGEEFVLVFKRAYYAYDHDRDGLLGVESNGADRFLGARFRGLLGTVADVWFFATIVLGLVGLPAFFRDGRASPQRVFFALCMLTFAVVPLGLYGLPRFHVPVLPLLCVAAAVPLVRFWERRQPGAASAEPAAEGMR